jgi:zinc finger-containing ubiquitin peptidase 1
VEKYFAAGCSDDADRVSKTWLPPIYFQHKGHSLTIVGIERRIDGARNLIVFDPMFKPAAPMKRLVGVTFRYQNPSELLKAYRRGDKYLKRFNDFELLQ